MPLTLTLVQGQLAAAGFSMRGSCEDVQRVEFRDVGALVWYLTMIPWVIPGFAVEAARPQLRRLHDALGCTEPIAVEIPAFYLVAIRTQRCHSHCHPEGSCCRSGVTSNPYVSG